MKNRLRIMAGTAFALYGILMLWLLFGQRMGTGPSEGYLEQLAGNLNLVPFKTIYEYLRMSGSDAGISLVRHAFINLAGNVVMFVPPGFFLPLFWPRLRTFGRFLPCVIKVVLMIEAIQLFTLLGVCDIDDLILNVSGAAAGYMLFRHITVKEDDAK